MSELAKVPATLADDFRRDFHSAVRRYTNWEIGAVNPFFTRWDLLRDAVDRQRSNPFDDATGQIDPLFGPAENQSPLYAHCDLAQSHDSCGLAFVSIPRYTTVLLADGRTEITPVIRVEMLVRLTPTAGQEIDFRTVRSVIYSMRDRGFYVRLVTYDQFQSVGEIQELNRSGIAAAKMSIDRTAHGWLIERRTIPGTGGAGLGRLVKHSTDQKYAAPYITVRQAVNERRISLPLYQEKDGATQWERECRDLAWHEVPGVVVKSPNSTDDLAQAVAGAVFNAVVNTVRQPDEIRDRESERDRRTQFDDLEPTDPLDAWEKTYFSED